MATFLLCIASNVVIAGILAVFALALTRFWRSPHLAHALWLLVLIKLVTPPIVQLPLGRFTMGDGEASAPTGIAGAREVAPVGSSPDVRHRSALSPAIDRPLSSVDDAAGVDRQRGVWACLLDAWRAWLVGAWAMGTAGFVGVSLRRHMRLLALTADGRSPAASITQDARRLSRKMGLAACPLLRVTAARVCPFVAPGVRSPMIMLPSWLLAELDRDQINAILAHELAHVRRRDHWVRIFEVCALALNWWNPIAWWAGRQLRQAEEECCDAWVVWVMPEKRRAYGETLLHTVEYLTRRVVAAIPAGTSFLGCQLKRRIEMVMNRSADRSMSLTALACVLIVGMLVLPAGFALGPAKALSEPTGPSASVVQEEDGDCEARVQSEPDKGSDPGRIVGVNDVSVFYQDEMDPRIRVDHESSFRVCLEEEGDELVIATACCEGPQVDDAAVRRLVPLMERLPHLRAVEFRDTSITDKGLEPLARLRTVRRLFVRSSAGDKAVPIRLTDAAFERIAKLPNLEVLEISNGTINGEGCRHLRSLSQLRVIDLRRTDVDDTTLEYLEDLPQLREVVLWGTRISDEGLAHLAKLPNLEEVYLMDTDIS